MIQRSLKLERIEESILKIQCGRLKNAILFNAAHEISINSLIFSELHFQLEVSKIIKSKLKTQFYYI